MYSIHKFRKTKRRSKIEAINVVTKETAKQNLRSGKLKGTLPETRVENGISIHQESMYQAFLNKQDNSDF